MFRDTPETRSLFLALAILFLAYTLVHWRYYFYIFPHEVGRTLDPRSATLVPKTNWGIVVRCLLAYAVYRALPWLSEKLRQKRATRAARRQPTADPVDAAAAAQRRQQRLEQEGAGQAPAAQRASPGTSSRASTAAAGGGTSGGDDADAASTMQPATAAAVTTREAPLAGPDGTATAPRPASVGLGGGSADDVEARQRAWLARLQAQQDQAAAERAKVAAEAAARLAAEKAAAGAAKAAAAASGAEPAETAAAAAASRAAAIASTAPGEATPIVLATAATSASASQSPAAEARPTEAAAAAAAARAAAAQEAEDQAAGSGAGGKRLQGKMHGSGSSGSLPRAVSGSNMVPLREAQEAEERQRQWLQQLSAAPGLTPLQREAMEAERQLKAEQDAAFEASLAEDRRRAEERAAAEAAAAEAERRAAEERHRLEQLRVQLREALPEEPDKDDEAAVLVRVRLPDGRCHTRRFAQQAPVQQVRDWLQSLDAFPLWDPARWSLVNSYPRQVLGAEGGPQVVSEVAQDAKQVAMFVQEH